MQTGMASTLPEGLQKTVNIASAATQNAKLVDIAKDTTDYHDKNARITTDWGNKVSNTYVLF